MVRLVLVIAVFALGFVVVKRAAGEGERGRGLGVRGARRRDRAGCRASSSRCWPPGRTRPRSCASAARSPASARSRRIAGKLGAAATTASPPRCARSPTSAAARELRKVRSDIRRDFDALNRLSSIRGGASPAEVSATLAEVYSAPVLAALGADGLRAFAERYAGRTEVAQKVKVLDFEGVFVSGRRALAQVVYRLSMRGPSGHYVARAPATWTVTLAQEDGRWRFVRGLET